MPSFRSLPKQELDALIDYVKYLSIRGKFERNLISLVAEVDGEVLIDFSLIEKSESGEAPSEDDVEEFQGLLYDLFEDWLLGDIGKWSNPDRKVTEIPDAPRAFDLQHEAHDELVQQGRELFFSTGCAQCHGDTAFGDGLLSNYDDWAKDRFDIIQVDTLDPEIYQDYLAAGALPARPVRPRNLHFSVLRGGNHPNEIFLRILNGIEGTPMPSSLTLTSDETWALVAYVRSLPFENTAAPKPVNEKQIAR